MKNLQSNNSLFHLPAMWQDSLFPSQAAVQTASFQVWVLAVVPAAWWTAAEVGHSRLQVAAGGEVTWVMAFEMGMWSQRQGKSRLLGLSLLIGCFKGECVTVVVCRAGNRVSVSGGRVRPAVSQPQAASPLPWNLNLLPHDWFPGQGCYPLEG